MKFIDFFAGIGGFRRGSRSSKSKRTMTLLATRERLMSWKAGRGAGKTKTRGTEQHEAKWLCFSVRKMSLQPLCKQRGNDRQLYWRSKRTLLRLRRVQMVRRRHKAQGYVEAGVRRVYRDEWTRRTLAKKIEIDNRRTHIMKIIAVMTQKGGVEKTMKMCLCGLSISDSENIRDFSRWQASDAHGEASGQGSWMVRVVGEIWELSYGSHYRSHTERSRKTMAKKMNDEEMLEAMEQAVRHHQTWERIGEWMHKN